MVPWSRPKGYIIGGRKGQSHGETLHVIAEQADGTELRLDGENSKVANNLCVKLPHTGDHIVLVKPTRAPESPRLRFGITFVIQWLDKGRHSRNDRMGGGRRNMRPQWLLPECEEIRYSLEVLKQGGSDEIAGTVF